MTTVQLACSACGALGEIARRGPLPLPDKKGEEEKEEAKAEGKGEGMEERKEEEKEEEKEEGVEGVLLKTSVMECLKKKLKSAKEIKVNFLQLLANCVCCSTFSELKLVTDNLLFSTTFPKLVSVRTNTRTVEGALCPRSWLPCCWRPSIPRQTLPSPRPLSGEGGEGR